MPLFDRVLIVGTGFMGNALANALYDNQVAGEIFGIEPNEAYRQNALDNKCYSEIVSDREHLSATPTISIVCTPIETVAPTVAFLLTRFPNSIVTDIGSIKQKIIDQAEDQNVDLARYVPGHPITGSDRSGPIQPPASIFSNRSCVVTPLPQNQTEDLELVKALWQALGSQVFELTPAEHDLLLGMTSHMPHAVASVLSASLSESELQFCGTGIRDTIRIAKSNPLLWKQIFVQNRESVLLAMDRFQENFNRFRHSLETDSVDELISILEKGQKNRDALGN